MPSVAVVLLAAGESTRMGRQKALIPWRGAPSLIDYHLRELADVAAVSCVIVVTGNRPEPVAAIAAARPGVTVVHNPAYASGKVSSILAGMAAVPDDAGAIMLLAVDQPRPAAVLRAIIEAHAASGALITLPVHAGRRGHPPVFARALLPELQAISEDTRGIRAVIAGHAADVRELSLDDPDVLLDLNTPSDAAAGG